MTNDLMTAAPAAGTALHDNLITLETVRGRRIEITLDNQRQLERELALTLDNPLAALMAQVAIEYREMSGRRHVTCA